MSELARWRRANGEQLPPEECPPGGVGAKWFTRAYSQGKVTSSFGGHRSWASVRADAVDLMSLPKSRRITTVWIRASFGSGIGDVIWTSDRAAVRASDDSTAIDWLLAVREHGLARANEMFPPEEGTDHAS